MLSKIRQWVKFHKPERHIEMNAKTKERDSSNRDIYPTELQNYLEYYRNLEEPGYALLVTGAWGTGKTFQIKHCVPEGERYYVSLFGVETVEQIHAEVLAAAFPAQEKLRKVAEGAGETAKAIGGVPAILGGIGPIYNAVLQQQLKSDRTLIFDDLERSNIKTKDLLGVINLYVEQKGFRVMFLLMMKNFRINLLR